MRLYITTKMINSIMKTMGRSQHQRETARVNIAMDYKSVQWILFLMSLGKIIIVYQIFLWVDLDTILFPMCSINLKIYNKKWWRYFSAFFALHASTTADLLSSISHFPLVDSFLLSLEPCSSQNWFPHEKENKARYITNWN